MRFDLGDQEWALLEPLMPKVRKSARADDRRIMNAIVYVLRTGMPWRDLAAARRVRRRRVGGGGDTGSFAVPSELMWIRDGDGGRPLAES